MTKNGTATPNDKTEYEVGAQDLPLCCPMPNMSLWNSHPKVFLPIEDATDNYIICPYCGTKYILKK